MWRSCAAGGCRNTNFCLADTEPDQCIIELLLPGWQNRKQCCAALVDTEPGLHQPSHQIECRKTAAGGRNVPLRDQRLIQTLKSQRLQTRSCLRVSRRLSAEQPKPFENESSGADGADALAAGVKRKGGEEICGDQGRGYAFLAADEQHRIGTVGLAKRTVH